MRALSVVILSFVLVACGGGANKDLLVPDSTKSMKIDATVLTGCTEPKALASSIDQDNLKFTSELLKNLADCSLKHKTTSGIVKEVFNLK